MIVPHPSWDALLPGLSGTVYLMGAGNCGKSTLARWLADSGGESIALLDGDAGQPTLGPPGTLGLALPGGAKRFRFVGALTPSLAPLATLTGLRLLLDAARTGGAATVIVDPCGYIRGEGGREFQRRSIEILRPDHIVAVGRDGDIDAVLSLFSCRAGLSIHRLPVSPRARRRSQAARRRYRDEQCARYLEGAKEIVVGPGVPRVGHTPTVGHFAALLDTDGWILTAGIVSAAGAGAVTLTAPPPVPGIVASLEIAGFRPQVLHGHIHEE
jgi:polynucleotide 5'-hydroxyl-kinase GRC3/NOL9